MEKSIKNTSSTHSNSLDYQIICYVAGHSGGHIIPCLTLAQQEKNKYHARILFITSTKALDQKIIQHDGNVDHHYMLTITQQRQWYLLPLLAVHLCWAFVKSLYIFIRHRPVRVVSTGSIVAVASCVAAWLLRIPIELFEVNAKPGKTIQFLAHFATKIHVCFAQLKHDFGNIPCEVRPYPIRFTQNSSPQFPTEIAHFHPHRFTIFIQGGSQGSSGISLLMRQLIETYSSLAAYIQVIHQTGDTLWAWHAWYAQHKIPAYIFAYEHEVSPYYQRADIIVCRAGAGTLFETLYFKKPCITIPLKTSSTSHQWDNALAMAAAYPSSFFIISQDSTAVHQLYNAIHTLLQKNLYLEKKCNTDIINS